MSNTRAQVLVVDDSALLCDGLKRHLRTAGIPAISVTSAEIAMELVSREALEVMITDMLMPGMNGQELLEHVQRLAPTLPCIVMTGHARKELIGRVLAVPNVVAILVKPMNPQRLIDLINVVHRERPNRLSLAQLRTLLTAEQRAVTAAG